MIEVTGICHNNCKYCSYKKNGHSNFQINDFIGLLTTLKQKGLISTWLTGGEPLHDFERFSIIINNLINEGIDTERISTSLIVGRILIILVRVSIFTLIQTLIIFELLMIQTNDLWTGKSLSKDQLG